MQGFAKVSASPLVRFFTSAIVWLVLLTAVWSFVAPWTSHPVASLTHMALEFGAPQWVGKVTKAPGMIEAETRIQIAVSGAPPGVKADIVVEAEPQHYAYGLPIVLALLLAGSRKYLVVRALGSYLLLLPAQAFSLTFDLLRKMTIPAEGGVTALGIQQWQLECIAYCYQLGTLVMPTMIPVLIWLWMDREFFVDVLKPHFFRAQSETP